MRRIFLILLLISFNILEAQKNMPFSNFDIGFYSGINFHNTNNIRGDFIIEIKTNISFSLYLKASAGYLKTLQPYPNNYIVREYNENKIDSFPRFFAGKYNLVSRDYDIFPLTLGIQYNIIQSILSPYISIDVAYNFINTFIHKSPSEVYSYNSIDEVPDEFKGIKKKEDLPDNSYGIILGLGSSYQINPKLNLDVRYLFKYDNKIINTHHFIIGVYF